MIKDIMQRFDDWMSEHDDNARNISARQIDNLKLFIQEEIEKAYLAGRTCKQNEIDYHVQEAKDKIKEELSKINSQYDANSNPIIRDTIFGVTHRIETFINYLK